MKKSNKIRLYKILAVAAALFIAWSLSVFSDTPDVTERAVVTMMGIDAGDGGGVRVSVHVITPSTGDVKFRQESAESGGKDIFEALDGFTVRKGKKVEFGQCGMLVVGKSLCERGLLPALEALYTAGIVSPGIVTVAATGSAADFLKTAEGLGEETSENIAKLITRFQDTTQMPMLYLLTYLNGELSESGASFLPRVAFTDGAEGSVEEPEASGQQKTNIESVGTAVVFKAGKEAGALTEQETSGLTYTLRESKKGSCRLEGFSFENRAYGPVYGDIRYKSVKLKTDFVDGKPVAHYKLKLKIEMSPNHETIAAADQSAVTARVAESFSESVESDIAAAALAQKTLNADFLNLTARFSRMNAKEMKVYLNAAENNFLRDLTVTADAEVIII